MPALHLTPPPAAPSVGTAATNKATSDKVRRSRPLVLIVEDERLTALDLQRRVTQFGYDTVQRIAITAGEAVALAEMYEPDLVLMDVRLKGDRDGIDAARVILDQIGPLPIIYLTAFSTEDTVSRVRDLKPAGFLFKPIEFQRLEREIAHALDWPQQ